MRNGLKLTAANIVKAIASLPKNVSYEYASERTKTKVLIDSVVFPEGPIYIKRWNTKSAPTISQSRIQSISKEMIWRIANAFVPGKPINFDRVLAGSYNTRSALEALLLHTEEFYTCKPGRIELLNSSQKIKKGHKHVIWLPEQKHEMGLIAHIDTDVVISELSHHVVHEQLELDVTNSLSPLDIEIQRRHAQIQIALIHIGEQLGFRTWVASNDQGIIYKGKPIIEMDSVIPKLSDERMLFSYGEAALAGRLIDCIWFRNGKAMPAVIEIEQSTGVTSGLARMKNFKDKLPSYGDIRWVIAAPDEDRSKVLKEISKEQFSDLDAKYFPYSAIEELYDLCNRRKISGVTDQFLDSFMSTKSDLTS